MQTFERIFHNIWKRMEEMRSYPSETGYLRTSPENKKRRLWSMRWAAKQIKQLYKAKTGESQSRLVFLCSAEKSKEYT